MPIRLTKREPRRDGPTPFSAEWLNAPPSPPTRRVVGLPAWFPSERVLSAVLVLLLVAGAAWASAAPDGDPATRLAAPTAAATEDASAANDETALAVATGTALATASATVIATTAPVPTAGGNAWQASQPALTPAAGSELAAAGPTAGTGGDTGDALLPRYRILTYYGHPHDENMGILGEFEKDELLAKLREQAAAYEAADPSRPVMAAFEIIATVAQPQPGVDGTFLLPTDPATLVEYAEFAAANNLLLFLDLQIGRDTVANEIEKVRFLLERPYVHLALDPEFAMAEGETPGIDYGGVDAWAITYAQETLAAIAAEHGLPPKVLIVHQFVPEMIRGKNQLYPVPGVQLVINADGHGAPTHKTEIYGVLVRDEPVEFAGIKLFYREDDPVMAPEAIVALDPSPHLVMYQ